ncbi:hypothetical protein [Actinoplanes sp. HUAS TT8]|uniref:hypothetical protein n=1 Tax=Actinoplanes sp. HUAS TT8 TaxID=3447453 RepID=UPI003F527299
MFDGLDDIDWASMEHAYGPAEEVPDLIRGLIDPDPAVREESLDEMYGAVHHQGDVYECTVAAVPFLLEALLDPHRPGRGDIAGLLTSIAEQHPADPLVHRAHALVLAAAPALAGLAGDPDPELRAALPPLLVVVSAALPGLADRFFTQLTTEPDAEIRQTLLDALGKLGGPGILDRLLAVDGPASTRVAALIAVARADPARVPLDDAAGLLERAYAEEAPPEEPAGFVTDTLTGSLRQRAEEDRAGRRAPHAGRLIDSLTDALGPRVTERIALLETLLESPHADVAGDALHGATKLIERRRGDHRGLVTRIAGFLTHPDAELAERAARSLSGWGPVARPAADAAAARLAEFTASGRPWTIRWASTAPDLHPLVALLARCGDERALPYLYASLTLPEVPKDVGYLLAHFPADADRIVAAVTRRLATTDAEERSSAEWSALLSALRACGPAAAPAVPELLAAPLTDWSAVTLGRIGPAAIAAAPALHAAVTGGEDRLAVPAAGALRRIDGWPGALAALTARIEGPAGRAALDEIAAMGVEAAAAGPYLATFLDTPPEPPFWSATAHGLAYWQVTGDLERSLPLVTAAWNGNQHTRPVIAERAAGGLAAALTPLFRAELAESRRHGLFESGWSSSAVLDDEKLLATLRTF